MNYLLGFLARAAMVITPKPPPLPGFTGYAHPAGWIHFRSKTTSR